MTLRTVQPGDPSYLDIATRPPVDVADLAEMQSQFNYLLAQSTTFSSLAQRQADISAAQTTLEAAQTSLTANHNTLIDHVTAFQDVANNRHAEQQREQSEILRQLSDHGRALAAAEARLNALPPLRPVAPFSPATQPTSTAPHSSTNG